MGKWNDELYVKCYQLALNGLTDSKIAKTLGIRHMTFINWKKDKPALAKALDAARLTPDSNPVESYRDYVYAQLPMRLKALWDEIDKCGRSPSGLERIQSLLKDNGEDAQKHLFLYALVSSCFDASKACRRLGLPYFRLKKWIERDPDFALLLDEIQLHKKNFFEGSLIKLVKEGDVNATLFVNRTVNKDRGYGDKIEVEHKGQIHHNHVLDISKFPLNLQRDIMKAQKQIEAKEHDDNIVNGELLEVH